METPARAALAARRQPREVSNAAGTGETRHWVGAAPECESTASWGGRPAAALRSPPRPGAWAGLWDASSATQPRYLIDLCKIRLDSCYLGGRSRFSQKLSSPILHDHQSWTKVWRLKAQDQDVGKAILPLTEPRKDLFQAFLTASVHQACSCPRTTAFTGSSAWNPLAQISTWVTVINHLNAKVTFSGGLSGPRYLRHFSSTFCVLMESETDKISAFMELKLHTLISELRSSLWLEHIYPRELCGPLQLLQVFAHRSPSWRHINVTISRAAISTTWLSTPYTGIETFTTGASYCKGNPGGSKKHCIADSLKGTEHDAGWKNVDIDDKASKIKQKPQLA
ncbi:uncharacterized protein LOC132522480 [Lagenorhynchus albirostris]|uniref:uncharacterized protein LOC132522480 n=1 Tax=Lagenorhynchus albirostris TaxID=27610 RepID=UPI0028E2B437|nr:uncharacterized protein LOC132522480 [Lagenorhynchus albirostris]